MATTSRASCKSVEDVEIFQVLEGKKKEIRQQDLLLGEQVVLQLTENFWGKWHHIHFDNFSSSTKSYENAIGTRNVQLWHYKGK